MARVLIVDDESDIQSVFRSILNQAGHAVTVADSLQQAFHEIDHGTFDVVLLDVHLPDGRADEVLPEILARDPFQRVVMVSGDLDVEVVARSRRNGAFHYYTKPFTGETLLQIVDLALESRHESVSRALGEYSQGNPALGLTGTSPTACAVNLLIDRASKSDRTPVLLSGEIGTGKEMAAQIVHRLSNRARMPFHVVNCSGVTPGSLETELFGIEVEAGPNSRHIRKGVLELAEGGTVLIKDLDRLPENLQERLISVVTEGRLMRTHGRVSRPTSVRIMGSTTVDLPSLSARGLFNSALLVSLAGFHIHIAALRDRVEDIAALAQEFAAELTRELGRPAPAFPTEVIHGLSKYNWPGNARELRNVIERLVLLSEGRQIRLDAAGIHQLLQSGALQGAGSLGRGLNDAYMEEDDEDSLRFKPSRGRVPSQRIDSTSVRFPNPWLLKDILPLEEVERAYIARTLEMVRQNRTIGAKKLGISRSTLQRKLQAYGMDTEEHLVTQSPD